MKNRISNLLANGKSTPILVGVGAIGAGFTFVYIFNRKKKKLTNAFEFKIEHNQIESEPVDYEDYITDAEHETDQMIEELDQYEELPKINIFMVDDNWDYEQELEQRNPDEPYVIHADEYINDEMGYKQETITYYEADDIMSDISDTPIYNWHALTGDLKWGHGSKDKNVVYIRNEKMRKEWEVLRHHGSFQIEVAGLDFRDTELKHSILKFRDD